MTQRRQVTPRERFEGLRTLHRDFYEHVKAEHVAHANVSHGHDLTHDVTVAQHSLVIAPNEWIGEKAWVASFCHSMDYWGYVRGDPEKSAANFKAHVMSAMAKLSSERFAEDDLDEISQAALRHQEKNQDDQGIVQQVLQDSDRLANLMVSVLFRIGQGYPDLPIVEMAYLGEKNPESTYFEPRSCLDDMRNCMTEYEPQFRLSKAKDLAGRYIQELHGIIEMIQRQHDDLGIVNLEL